MNFVIADMADELGVLGREIASHASADARFLATVALLVHLNNRRDHYGLVLGVDSARQTLRHLGGMSEGIELIKDTGGAVVGLRIGPHFPNDWHLLELAREVCDLQTEQDRLAAVSTMVQATLMAGETRCWELRPVIARPSPSTLPTVQYGAVMHSPEVLSNISKMMGAETPEDLVAEVLKSLTAVIELGTEHGGTVEIAGLGRFTATVYPNGEVGLLLRSSGF